MRPKQSAGDARGELQAAALVHEARPVEFWGTPSVAFLPRRSRQALPPGKHATSSPSGPAREY